MTIPENVRDVALSLTNKLPAALLFVIAAMVGENLAMYFVITDISKYRIDAIVKIFEACVPGIKS